MENEPDRNVGSLASDFYTALRWNFGVPADDEATRVALTPEGRITLYSLDNPEDLAYTAQRDAVAEQLLDTASDLYSAFRLLVGVPAHYEATRIALKELLYK